MCRHDTVLAHDQIPASARPAVVNALAFCSTGCHSKIQGNLRDKKILSERLSTLRGRRKYMDGSRGHAASMPTHCVQLINQGPT